MVFCPALAALVSPVQNIFFLTAHYFTPLSPSIALQARQAAVLRRLSLSLIVTNTHKTMTPLREFVIKVKKLNFCVRV